MKRLVSWNVNGIRACVNKGFNDWVKEFGPDIICLQEIKATAEQFMEATSELSKYKRFSFSAQKKGYSGVALLSKEEPIKIEYGLGIDEFDSEGRMIIAEYDDFVLMGGYFPNGQRDHSRVPYKLEFYNEVLKRFKKYKKQGKNIIITGDFNTAHHNIDLANPKGNKKTTGFLPEEREWMDKYISAGMTDALRLFYPELEGQYTWWTYRNNCRERNIGWRIDYFMINQEFESKLNDCRHLPEIMGSDHCPILLELKS